MTTEKAAETREVVSVPREGGAEPRYARPCACALWDLGAAVHHHSGGIAHTAAMCGRPDGLVARHLAYISRTETDQPGATPPHRDGDGRPEALAKSASSPARAASEAKP